MEELIPIHPVATLAVDLLERTASCYGDWLQRTAIALYRSHSSLQRFRNTQRMNGMEYIANGVPQNNSAASPKANTQACATTNWNPP
eukprot:gene15201-biopygen18688